MGTLSFDGQFGKMRKAEDWIVYPMQDSTETIRIQNGSNQRAGSRLAGHLSNAITREQLPYDHPHGLACLVLCVMRRGNSVCSCLGVWWPRISAMAPG
jgi:hypothetical protein